MVTQKEDVVFPAHERDRRAMEKKQLDRKMIKSMAGTFRVSFQFAETFSPDRKYEYHDRKFEGAKEVVLLLEETEDRISLQHLLYVGKGHIIKHWRQDWIYENQDLLILNKGHEWRKIKLTPKQARGTWTQKVYQVDDAPRYEGFGTWVHVDGRSFWQSTADAPLPRREISKRNDYNVLRRNSHIEIFKDGSWVLDQDNEKIIRSEKNEDVLLCMEKGIERFTILDYDSADAVNWWDDNASFWSDVREAWSEIRENMDFISVKEDEKLYMAQFELASRFRGENYDSNKARQAIRDLLAGHVEGYPA